MTEGKSAASIRDSWQGKGLQLGDKLGFAPLLWRESQLKLDIAFSVLVLGAKGRLTRDNSNFIDRPCPNITRFNHRQDLCQMFSSPNFILKMNLLQ